MSIAVTGASGHLGRLVVESLLARGADASQVVALARTAAKVADLADRGVEVREADYARPETLGPARRPVPARRRTSRATSGPVP